MTGEQGVVCGVLLCYRAGRTNRPHLHHSVLRGLAVKVCLQNDILAQYSGRQTATTTVHEWKTHVNGIATLVGNVANCTKTTRTKHNLVVVNERILVDTAEDITSRYVVADLER